MGKLALVLGGVAVAAVGIGIGVIIGYFSHPGNETSSSPEWVSKVESFFRDVSDTDVMNFIDGVEASNIRDNLK